MINLNVLEQCAQFLIKYKLTIAFAESATAGRVSSEFSLIKDAGQFLKGGLVCYDACLKEDILGVPHDLVEKYTPESAEVTKAITFGIQKLIEADIHVGITGLPAPGGSENEHKPVGTMFVYAIHKNMEIINKKIVLDGKPKEIILKTINHTAIYLIDYLKGLDK